MSAKQPGSNQRNEEKRAREKARRAQRMDAAIAAEEISKVSLKPDAKAACPEPPNQESNNRTADLPNITDKVMAGCTAAMLVVVGLQAYFNSRQVDEARNANEVAQRAAKSAEDSVKLASGTAHKQLRAYVGIVGLEMEEPNAERTNGKNGRMLIRVKNFGQTPANNVIMHLAWKTVPIPRGKMYGSLPGDFAYPGPPPEYIEGGGPQSSDYIEPGKEGILQMLISDRINVFSKDFLGLQLSAYFYGYIEFTDIFGDRWGREFCYLYAPWQKVGERLMVTDAHNGEIRLKSEGSPQLAP